MLCSGLERRLSDFLASSRRFWRTRNHGDSGAKNAASANGTGHIHYVGSAISFVIERSTLALAASVFLWSRISYLQSERNFVAPLRWVVDECVQNQSAEELTDHPAEVDVRYRQCQPLCSLPLPEFLSLSPVRYPRMAKGVTSAAYDGPVVAKTPQGMLHSVWPTSRISIVGAKKTTKMKAESQASDAMRTLR
jgi:hypothetical protein